MITVLVHREGQPHQIDVVDPVWLPAGAPERVLPLTVLTGLYGMNVVIPHLPGTDATQFWWIMGMVGVIVASMLWVFRRRDWL